MLAAAAVGASHPAVAGLLGLGAAGLAGGVVAMAWSVHARQIRLAEQLARRQFIVTSEAGVTDPAGEAEMAGRPGMAGRPEMVGLPGKSDEADRAGGRANGRGPEAAARFGEAAGAGPVPRMTGPMLTGPAMSRPTLSGPPVMVPVIIDGPDTVVTGDQARYRVRPSGSQQVVSWAAGGGSVSHCPDPAHSDELLLVADRPGDLTVSVRVREGLAERRATKSVTAVPEVTAGEPPITLRLFLHGWALLAAAVLIVGFAGALVALGNLTSADFIALVTPLAALLAVIAVARGPGDAGRPGHGHDAAGPRL